MISVEEHIESALDRQINEVKDHPMAAAAVQRFHDMVKHNRDHMKQYQEKLGTTGGNPIKKVGAAVLGAAAGVVDMVRTEGISKALRDDYTAFNLAAISYTMLYTTANALNDQELASICEEHLRSYAKAIQEINQLIPDVVVDELRKDKHQVNASAVSKANEMTNAVWKETAPPMAMPGGMTSSMTSDQMPG
jgi:ferritin-like metal-binding protein YciE